MRITAIEQPFVSGNDGLARVSMHQLNRIVILAGANGSGKTRLLQRIAAIRSRMSDFESSYEGFEIDGELFHPISFVSTNLKFTDPSSMALDAIIGQSGNAETPGVDHLADSALAYICTRGTLVIQRTKNPKLRRTRRNLPSSLYVT